MVSRGKQKLTAIKDGLPASYIDAFFYEQNPRIFMTIERLSSMKMGSLNMGQLSDTISKGSKESFLVCDRNIFTDGKTT